MARRLPWPAFLAFLACAALLRPGLAGWPLPASAAAVGVAALYVVIPGWVTLRALRVGEEDALGALLLAWVLGQALLAAAYLPACLLDARSLLIAYPLPFLLVAWLRTRRPPADPLPHASVPDLLACAVLVAPAALAAYCESPSGLFLHGPDPIFHAGNAAELRWRWPMQDPRLAGEPLRYHFFSYVLPCVESLVLRAPVREVMFGSAAALPSLGLALAAFVAARGAGARAWLAALCGAALVLHADLGAVLERWLGVSLQVSSYLDRGLYRSGTTALGLTFLLALVHRLRPLLAEGEAIRRGDLVVAGALAFGASGTKGSILPPLLAGLAFCLLLRVAYRRPFARSWIALWVTLLVSGLPMTLFLAWGEASYASSMFSLEPFAAQRMSAFHTTVSSWLAVDPARPSGALLAALAPAWTVLFLGSGTLGLLAWILCRARPAPAWQLVLLATAVCGLVPAWLLAAPSLSQLFFAYDSQACLMVLAASGLEGALRGRGLARALLPGSFAVVVALQAHHGADRFLRPLVGPQPESARGSHEYRAALGWARDHLPADAVLLASASWLGPSTWSERRVFFEDDSFSPRTHARWRVPWRPALPAERPFAEREQLQRAFLADPEPGALARVRTHLREGVPLYALRDDVRRERARGRARIHFRVLSGVGSWGRTVGAELVLQTPRLEIYRLPDLAPPAADPLALLPPTAPCAGSTACDRTDSRREPRTPRSRGVRRTGGPGS